MYGRTFSQIFASEEKLAITKVKTITKSNLQTQSNQKGNMGKFTKDQKGYTPLSSNRKTYNIRARAKRPISHHLETRLWGRK